jgi:ATP-dependent Lon protease
LSDVEQIPKILAFAPPGVGRTFYTKTVARILGTTVVSIAMNATSDRGQIGGLSASWRGAKMGKLAKGLLIDQSIGRQRQTASPPYPQKQQVTA